MGRLCLSRLEEEDGNLSEVEVDEVLRLVGDVGSKVTANDAMPGGVVLLIELLLDVGGDVLLNVVLLEGGKSDVDGILLHGLAHIGVLDHGFASFRHDDWIVEEREEKQTVRNECQKYKTKKLERTRNGKTVKRTRPS